MKRILYISYDGMTDPLGQSQVLPYLCGLADRGYEFVLLSCEKARNFESQEGAIRKIIEGKSIQWMPVQYSENPPVLSTLLNIRRLRSKAKQICKQAPFQIVHCRSYIASLIGLILKRKFGVKFIFDMRGFWADERVEGGLWNLKNPLYKWIYKYFKRKEAEFLQEADHVISLTEGAKIDLQGRRYMQENPLSISVIPCCVDLDLFSADRLVEEERIGWRTRLGIGPDDFVLSYIGSIGTWYMLDEMLQFFKRLLGVRPNSRFMFLTGEDPEVVRRKATSLEIPADRIIVCKASRSQVPVLLSLSDVSIFFIKPSYAKIASSPTKLGEIFAMGIPVICNSGVGDLDLILSEMEASVLVEKFALSDYDKVIAKIDNLMEVPKQRIVVVCKNRFSLVRGVDSYDKVYAGLLRSVR